MSYQSWLDKAAENLAAAQLCFDNGYFNACANRLYYAMFHAGIAALMKHGLLQETRNIGHDWLQSNFSNHLIHRRKVFAARFRSYLPDAILIRIAADYESFSVSKAIAASALKKAKEFLDVIKQETAR